MKNRSIACIIQVALAVIVFFGIASGLCYASGIAIGEESVTISFYGEESGVYYLITDPQGRRTGYDPVSKQEVEEFPAAFDFSLAVIDGVPKFIRDEQNDLFHGSADFNLIPGTYTIEVFGVVLTAYDLVIRISRIIPGEGPVRVDIKTVTPEQIAAIKARSTALEFEGVIDKGLTSKFQFTYTSDPTKPAGTAMKVVTPSSLKQDIILSRKIGWIDNDGIMQSLLKKVEAMEASIARGNIKTARNQLNAFINEVNAQKGKHIESYDPTPGYTSPDPATRVRVPSEGKAVKMLLEDAQYLLSTLTEGK